MTMPEPSSGHAEFERLVGTWEGDEIIHPSHWEPEGAQARGRFHFERRLNGFALILDYEQRREGQLRFGGHGVVTYDPLGGLYHLHWFDSIGSLPEHYRGPLEEGRLLLSRADREMAARQIYDVREADVMDLKLEVSPEGSDWRAYLEGRYHRI